MMMKGFLLNALCLALIVLCWNVQDTAARKTGLGLRGGVAASMSTQQRAVRHLQQGEAAKEGEKEEDEDENANILNCFANILAGDPAAIISSADLIGCFPDLVAGILGGGEAQSLQAVLSCVGAAIGCDEQGDAPENEDETDELENDKESGLPGILGDLFDGFN
jgi:ribosomal protein L12E/L44/L45/RPP1/RPP2